MGFRLAAAQQLTISLALLLPTFALPARVDASLGADPLAGAGDWAGGMALDGLALLALLLSLAVLLRLTARFIQSRWRTAVFALCLLGGMAAQFYLGVWSLRCRSSPASSSARATSTGTAGPPPWPWPGLGHGADLRPGQAAGLTGTLLSALDEPWVLGFFALVFIPLALAMFGFFELQMPAFLQSKVTEEATHIKGGSPPGAGGRHGRPVGPDRRPLRRRPLAGALLYIGQTRDALPGGAALFALASAWAPLIAVGASAGTLLRRVGPWMARVNQTFGVLLLATALWLAGPVLPEALVTSS